MVRHFILPSLLFLLVLTTLSCRSKESTVGDSSEQDSFQDESRRTSPALATHTDAASSTSEAGIQYQQALKQYERDMNRYQQSMRYYETEVAQWREEKKQWHGGEQERVKSFRREEELGGASAPVDALLGRPFAKPFPQPPRPPTKPTYTDYPARSVASPLLDHLQINPGSGIANCQLGDSAADAEAAFGPPSSKSPEYLKFAHMGVELNLKYGVVHAMHFFFNPNKYRPSYDSDKDTRRVYKGAVYRGVRANSSEEDVKQLFGKPGREYVGQVWDKNFIDGSRECKLSYDQLGIEFEFIDRQLHSVCVSVPVKR